MERGRVVIAAAALCVLALALAAAAALAVGGALDGSFSNDGRHTFSFANGANDDGGFGVAIQPDGKVVVAGYSFRSGTGYNFAVARLHPGGGLDQSFSNDGRRTFGFANGANDDFGNAVAIQPNGNIVVAGVSHTSPTSSKFAVARLRPDGGLDPSFSNDGKRTFGFAHGANIDLGFGVAIQQNGRIVVAGSSVQSGTGGDFAVARLRSGGGLDPNFSTDGRRAFGFANGGAGDQANGVAIQPNGKIVVAGQSLQSGTGTDFAVARLHPGGGLDGNFSTDGRHSFGFANGANPDFGNGVALQSNGGIVVAGFSTRTGTGQDFAVARVRPGGGLDPSFSTDGRRAFGFANGANPDAGIGVAIQPNGKIVVAGGSNQGATDNDYAVARLRPGGGLDPSFSTDGKRTFGFANGASFDYGLDVAIQQNGRIVVAGTSYQGGTGNDFAVARLLGG